MAYKFREECPYTKVELEDMLKEYKIKDLCKVVKATSSNIRLWTKQLGIVNPRMGASKNIELTDRQIQIINGTLMGDGALAKAANTVYLTISHCESQVNYLRWLKDELSSIVGNSWRYRESNKVYTFSTKTNNFLTESYDLFYNSNRKKKVPLNIAEILTPLSLAVWYMDDGYLGGHNLKSNGEVVGKNRRQFHLCTTRYSEEENNFLAEVIDDVFNMKPTVRKMFNSKYDKYYYYLYFPVKFSTDFIDIIFPHIHSDLSYKLP